MAEVTDTAAAMRLIHVGDWRGTAPRHGAARTVEGSATVTSEAAPEGEGAPLGLLVSVPAVDGFPSGSYTTTDAAHVRVVAIPDHADLRDLVVRLRADPTEGDGREGRHIELVVSGAECAIAPGEYGAVGAQITATATEGADPEVGEATSDVELQLALQPWADVVGEGA